MLTAFLIESYKNLQEDPQQVIIGVLWQISLQTNSYTIAPGHLNSTTPFYSDGARDSFAPSIAAERVNVCWFASLILSLSTASFGILVKQWLREYLAVDNAKPEERLRIRHHRFLGLKSWKLFEIAAFLPLILQLSLALFFVGLCFFTASVHRSIGTTSVVLVSGWALFFIFALLAPVLSSSCPYKTTFLKTPLSVVRLHILPIITHSTLKCKLLATFIRSLLRSAIILVCGGRRARSQDNVSINPTKLSDTKADIYSQEESQICTTNSRDVSIFATIDSLFMNTELLSSMRTALYQTKTSHGQQGPILVVRLALEVTRRRLNFTKVSKDSLSWRHTFPLNELSRGIRMTFVKMVADEFRHLLEMPDGTKDKVACMEEACWFLASGIMNNRTIPEPTCAVVCQVLDSISSRKDFMGCRIQWPQDGKQPQGYTRVVSIIPTLIRALDCNYVRTPLYVFFQCYFWNENKENTFRVPGSVLAYRLKWDEHATDDMSFRSLIALLELSLTLIRAAFDQRVHINTERTLSSGEVELVAFVLDIIPIILHVCPRFSWRRVSLSRAEIPQSIFWHLLFTADTLPQMLDCILARSQFLSTGACGDMLLTLLGAWFDISHSTV